MATEVKKEVTEALEAKEVLEAETVEILTETNEQTSSEEIAEPAPEEPGHLPGVPDAQIIEPPALPTGEEIHQALKTLISLQSQAGGEVSEGEPGDIFLCYDLCMRVRGEPELHIVDRRVLHRVLLPEGIHSATSEMEAALFALIQPFKQHLMGIIGRLTTQSPATVPKPTLPRLR